MDKLILMDNSVSLIGNGKKSRIQIGSRIITTLATVMLLLNACAPVMSTPDLPKENLTELKIEDTETIPTNTPTELPTLTPTNTKEPTPTKTELPTETPTPRPTVELYIPPGQLGYDYFYFPYTAFENHGMQMISFVVGELLDVEVEGEYVVVSIRTRMRNNEVILKSKTKGFNLFNNNIDTELSSIKEGYHTYITAENIDEIEKLIGIEIRPSFLYTIEKMPDESKKAIINTCEGRGMTSGELSARRRYIPVCANMATLYVDGIGKLNGDSIGEWLEEKDLNNIDFNLAVLTEIAYEDRVNN